MKLNLSVQVKIQKKVYIDLLQYQAKNKLYLYTKIKKKIKVKENKQK